MQNELTDAEKFQNANEGGAEHTEEFVVNKRVRTPTIIQMEATECGAVTLGIILSYYGKFVPIEELRIRCNVTRDGSSAWNISQAANFYGLDAHAYSLELEDLVTASLPAIIFWEFEHFVVFEGFGKDCFYINDPATGPRTVPSKEFDQAFTGIVLEFSPDKNFVRSGSPKRLLMLLYKLLKPVRSSFAFLFLTQIGLIIPSLALPIVSQIFIDQAFVDKDLLWAKGIFFSIVIMMFITGIFAFLQERASVSLRAKLSVRMSSQILWHLMRLPILFFSHRYPGELAYRINLVKSIVDNVSGSLAFTLLNCLLIFIYGIAIGYYSPLIASVAFIGAFLNIYLFYLIFRLRQDSLARFQAASAKNIAYSYGILQGIDTVKSMAMENLYFANWSGYYTKALNALKDTRKNDIVLNIVPPLISSLVFISLVGIGGVEILNGRITLGMFISLEILLSNFMTPLIGMVNFSQVIQNLKVDLTRLDDIIEYPIEKEFKEQFSEEKGAQKPTFKKLEGYVEVKDVAFGYSPLDPPIIENINFKIQPGKSIAIVGTTGCGKSTLAMLLAGLVHPWKGEILYDGFPRETLPHQQLVSSISLVEQAPFLFKGTIKDNLTFYNPYIKDEDMVAACQDACIHEEIMSREGGYQLILTEGGSNLSGGQRQRLEIARGLLKQPTFLILDECTSALDARVEEEVIRNIHRRGCSILMIAHRLSSIKNCDEILVLDKGQTVGRGTHEQLKKECEIYNELIRADKVIK